MWLLHAQLILPSKDSQLWAVGAGFVHPGDHHSQVQCLSTPVRTQAENRSECEDMYSLLPQSAHFSEEVGYKVRGGEGGEIRVKKKGLRICFYKI